MVTVLGSREDNDNTRMDVMTIHYKARVSSKDKMLNGLPIDLPVGIEVKCRIFDVDELKINHTQLEKEWYNKEVVPKIKDK